MFKEIGIKGHVMLMALLPSTLLALLLGSYFSTTQLQQTKHEQQLRNLQTGQHLAALAAQGLARNDETILLRIARTALGQADVRSIAFLSADRQRLAEAGPEMLNPEPLGDTSQPLQQNGHDATRLQLPVYAKQLGLTGPAPESAQSEQLLGWLELELSHQGSLLQGYRQLAVSLLIILASLAFSIWLAQRLSRSLSSPLQKIQDNVALIKEGHLETRLPPLGSREFDALAAGINLMAQSMLSAQEELQQSVDQAIEDVRQNLETIEIQNIELDLARREALEASRIKSEFLANMSHELRTPLGGIIGFANLLKNTELTPRQSDHLNTIQKSADNLLGIINEILDFSKIEAGKLALENIPFSLREIIQDTLTLLAPSAHEKSLELICLIYRDTPNALIGDPQRLKQVLTNLVHNAIKFTHQGSITIRAMVEDESPDQAEVRISVQDTGIGLSASEQSSLFQAFSQADNSSTRQAGGTGLGLVISKRLIEQMGGEIGVSSEPGSGSEFWISLNLPKTCSDDEPHANALLLGTRTALIEPHPLARQALQQQLEDLGLHVQTFAELQEFWQYCESATPSALVVLSVNNNRYPADLLQEQLNRLAGYGCLSLLLCPSTQQSYYHDAFPDAYQHFLEKPPCSKKLRQMLTQLLGQPKATQPQPLPSQSPQASHILCVDDNPANLLLVKTLLEDLGAKVCAVESGQQALQAFSQQRFDLIFMDVQMPEMDGYQTTRLIRQREAQQGGLHTPIVALTAHALASEKHALLQGGMDDYMTKPISPRQLAHLVLKWTGLSLQSSAPASERIAPSDALKVIDLEDGLRLAAGKPALAKDMLDMLLSSLHNDRQAIIQARHAEDRDALIERIHRLHGASRYCGVPQLRHACQRCETLLKQDAPDARAALDELDLAIARLLEHAPSAAQEAP